MLVRLSGSSRVGKACGSPPSGSASSYDGQRATITALPATSGFHIALLMAARWRNVSVHDDSIQLYLLCSPTTDRQIVIMKFSDSFLKITPTLLTE